jgi:hypothetical protein
MCLQQREQKVRDGVQQEIAGEITDAKLAVG